MPSGAACGEHCFPRRADAWRWTADRCTPHSGDEIKKEEEEHDYLHVFGNSRLPELKIGRSANPYARAAQLHASQPFTICVHALFPCAGHLETRVHKMLSGRRACNAAGKEWFACTLEEALGAIALAIELRAD